MVNKLFSIRRLRIGVIFTGISLIFVFIFLVFYKEDGINKNIEASKNRSLKNQKFINLKEINNNLNNPSKENFKSKDKGNKNKNKKKNKNKNKNKSKSKSKNIDINKENITDKSKEIYDKINKSRYKNRKMLSKSEKKKVDELFSEKTFFKLYHNGMNYRDSDDPEGLECPIPWKWVDNQDESDIIVLNVLDNPYDIQRVEKYSYFATYQKLLLISMESTSNYKDIVKNKDYFDFFIDYRLDSDVPIPYSYSFFDFTKPALPTKEKGKNGRGLAAAFISNCFATNERLEFLEELMEYVKIDSYGMCANNKEVYPEDYKESSWDTKLSTIHKYKFTIAFENSNDRDYVTEKFFQPLEAGSVPIFYGTSNIADFAPPHSYINARDFKDAKELAEYLKFLNENDKEYESYLEWKKTGNLGENLEHLIEIRKLNSICHLLKRIKGLWKNPYLTEWNRHDVPEKERACGMC